MYSKKFWGSAAALAGFCALVVYALYLVSAGGFIGVSLADQKACSDSVADAFKNQTDPYTVPDPDKFDCSDLTKKTKQNI